MLPDNEFERAVKRCGQSDRGTAVVADHSTRSSDPRARTVCPTNLTE
jgi:hypothetical protein